MASFFQRLSAGLGRTRNKFQEQVNLILDRGPNVDDDFWEGLEDALIGSDIGAPATLEIVDSLRDEAKRKALPDAYAVFDLLNEKISEQFCDGGEHILNGEPATLLFVGINGTGKTTTVGKIAKSATDAGRSVILGSADTFRAAAIEQLEVWSKRANVPMVTRKRGSDPASVCYDTIEQAEKINADLVLIDTAGRLHTSNDLMLELEKVCHVTRSRSKNNVYVILVIDATTGQNGLSQAKEFNSFLKLDGLIVTKLDGTAKGGIALAISKELSLPIIKIGVGESIEDLRDFNAIDFAKAFVGDLDNRNVKSKSKSASSNKNVKYEIEDNNAETVENDEVAKDIKDISSNSELNNNKCATSDIANENENDYIAINDINNEENANLNLDMQDDMSDVQDVDNASDQEIEPIDSESHGDTTEIDNTVEREDISEDDTFIAQDIEDNNDFDDECYDENVSNSTEAESEQFDDETLDVEESETQFSDSTSQESNQDTNIDSTDNHKKKKGFFKRWFGK